VGSSIGQATAQLAALGTVFTHPDHRGKGLANICSSHVLASIGRAGIRRIILNVEDGKVTARRIYERLGFQTACTYLDGECARI
jgi:predicted GNAT family acetyltransferase